MKTVRVEKYTPERKAEFLLSNAVDVVDYRKARRVVLGLGLNPDSIPHCAPNLSDRLCAALRPKSEPQ